MQPGISSFAFGWAVAEGKPPLDERDLLAFAQRHGLGVVQLGDNLPAHEMATERLAVLTEAALSGIRVELGARGLTDTRLERYIDLCTRSRAPLLRFVTDLADYRPSAGDLQTLIANALPALEAAGVTLGLENHDRFTARALRDLVDRIGNARVGICLDTANSLGAGEGLEYVADLLAPVTVNLHVKDVAITRVPYQMGFVIEGRALGEGQLPIREALARVAATGRCASVILESWTSPGRDIEETLTLERESVERSVPTLRKWCSLL
jgi:sugar phosphate isomerase/epimerase